MSSKQNQRDGRKPKANNQNKNKNNKNKNKNKKKQKKTKTEVRKPINVAYRIESKQPKTKSTKQGTIVSHFEMITEVLASADYSVKSMNINANNVNMFPWLSGIVSNFDKFKILNLQYEYIPSSATTRDGEFFMYIDVDSTDAPAPSYNLAMTQKAAQSGPVYDRAVLNYNQFKKDEALKSYCVLDTLVKPSDSELKQYCPGNFVYGNVGTANPGTLIGRLYARYSILLKDPDYLGSVSQYGQVNGQSTNQKLVGNNGIASPKYTGSAIVDNLGQVIAEWGQKSINGYDYTTLNFKQAASGVLNFAQVLTGSEENSGLISGNSVSVGKSYILMEYFNSDPS